MKIIMLFGLTFIYLSGFSQGKNVWGYIDKTGNMIITPQFEDAYSFSEGLASIKMGNKFGYIDKTGNIIIAPQYKDAYSFSEGLAKIYTDEDKYGYIDKTGKIIIEPKLLSASIFSEGLASIKIGNKFGYIDKIGNIKIEPQFKEAYSFSDNLAVIQVDNGKYGYIDTTGRIVIEPQFKEAYSFYDNLAVIQVDNDKYGYIDTTGRIVIEPQFKDAENFSEGLASVNYFSNWGYIDKTGKNVIEPQFKHVKPFSDGLACISIYKLDLSLKELVEDIQAAESITMSGESQEFVFKKVDSPTYPEEAIIAVSSLGVSAKEAIPVLIEKFPVYIDTKSQNHYYDKSSIIEQSYNEAVTSTISAMKKGNLLGLYSIFNLDPYTPLKEIEHFCFFEEPKVSISHSRTEVDRFGGFVGIEHADYNVTIIYVFFSGAYALSLITGQDFSIKQDFDIIKEDWSNWWKFNKDDFIADIIFQRKGIDIKNLSQEDKANILITFLQDWNSGIRWTTAMMLGEMKDYRAVDPLIVGLKDQNDYVRKYSALALGEIGGTKAIDAVKELLNDKSEEVRQAVQSIIDKL